MLVLKRLSDAESDGDQVIAVIRGSAANQDGRSNGLTAPNGLSQEQVLRDALADAQIEPHEVGYVETHGTGTSLGDPIEVQALANVLGKDRKSPLMIGSVKANIGHLEAAAGVAGVIKLVLALQHGEIPGQIHLSKPNPLIAWGQINVQAPTQRTHWPETHGSRRIGGVSSFGFSGTNVHLLIEQAQPTQPTAAAGDALQVLAISARQEDALLELSEDYGEWLTDPSLALKDAAYSINTGRAHFSHRLAVVAASVQDAEAGLKAFANGESTAAAIAGVSPNRVPRVAFLFTGQGAQYFGMARELYDGQPDFRATIDRCNDLLKDVLPQSLLSVLFGDGHGRDETRLIDDTRYTQPALFAVEYALARLWMSWGIKPAAVLGHSIGEYVAACVAGVFSLEDALTLVAARGRLMSELPRDGAMASLVCDERRVQEAIAPYSNELGIAAINGPTSVVISGRIAAVEAVMTRLAAEGVRTVQLNVSHAFHSPLVEPMIESFVAVARCVRFSEPQFDLISNVTGCLIGAEIANAAYWAEHVRAPVKFSPALQTLANSGCQVYLEVGPHPTLIGMGADCLPDVPVKWLPTLRRGRSDRSQMLNTLAGLYVAGANINWAGVDGGPARQRLVMPNYPFQRERFWVDTPAAKHVASREIAHSLLGAEVLQSLSEGRLFETRLSAANLPCIDVDATLDKLIVSSAVHIEMAIAAAFQALDAASHRVQIKDLSVAGALLVDRSEPSIVQTIVEPLVDAGGKLRIAGHDQENRRWQPLVSASFFHLANGDDAHVDLAGIRGRLTERVAVDEHCAWFDEFDLERSPHLRAVDRIDRRDGEVFAHVKLPTEPRSGDCWLHPALLEASLILIGAALPKGSQLVKDRFRLAHVDRIDWRHPVCSSCWTHLAIDLNDLRQAETGQTLHARMQLLDDNGRVLATFEGLQFKRVEIGALQPQGLPNRVRQMLHEVVWRDAPPAREIFPSEIPPLLSPDLARLVAQVGLDRYADFASRLNELVSLYIVKALRELGLPLAEGERVRQADAARLRILPRHSRLFTRVLTILAEDRILAADGDAWEVIVAPPEVKPEELYAVLFAEHPDCGAELELTSACASRLAEVLQGRIDPLTLLFPEGSLALTERLYRDSPPARTYNALIGKAVSSLASSIQSKRGGKAPIRLLEIGAGTGSTSAHVIPLLPRDVDYTFTDVSPAFLNRARESFADRSDVKYALLNIEQDPGGQGFDAGVYDIVLAANVMHATRDLSLSLAHARRLLAPGGTLVMLEGTEPQRFGDVTVGLLEGWWAYTDTQRRSYALLSQAGWLGLLNTQGFVHATAFPGVTAHPVLSQQQIFVAQVAAETSKRKPSRWLIVPDATGFAPVLMQSLTAAGDVAELLPAAPGDGLMDQLRDALASNPPVRGVVHLSALDAGIDEATDASALMLRQRDLIESTLAAVQTMVSHTGPGSPRLWFVTRGAQHVQSSASSTGGADPSQATLWGIGHVIAIEHPELACVRIDLDPACDAEASATCLRDELQFFGGEDQIAWRAGQRFARRLAAVMPASASQAGLQIDGGKSYLITGGLRGLGLLVTQWLVERGARHLAVMSRHEADAHAREVMHRLKSKGARVVLTPGDVSQREDVEAALAKIARTMPPLAGIIHAAGVLDDGVIAAQNWSRFATVMGPKVLGTWHLHWLTRDLPIPLEFMVLFSSGASLAGSPGQANHAAANAFEDAFAWYRQAQNRPTIAINWGPWSAIGAAAERKLDHPAFLKQIAPDDGLLALDFAMRRTSSVAPFERAQLAVLAADWSLLRDTPNGGGDQRLFTELMATAPFRRDGNDNNKSNARSISGAAADGAAGARQTLQERLLATLPNRRYAVLRDAIRAIAAKVLGLADPKELDVNEPLRQLGLELTDVGRTAQSAGEGGRANAACHDNVRLSVGRRSCRSSGGNEVGAVVRDYPRCGREFP